MGNCLTLSEKNDIVFILKYSIYGGIDVKKLFIIFIMSLFTFFVFSESEDAKLNLKVDNSWAGITVRIAIGSSEVLSVKIQDDGVIPVNILVGEKIVIIIPPQSIEYEKDGKIIIKTIKSWSGFSGISNTFEYISNGWKYSSFISMATFNCLGKTPLKTTNIYLVNAK